MKTVGIVGGGQLGMMLTEAASRMRDHISHIIVLDPVDGCPASLAGAEQIVAAYDDAAATAELAKRSDIVTYEFEGGNADALETAALSGVVTIHPAPSTLRTIQDKLSQKEMFASRGIPVPDFASASTPEQIREFLSKFGRHAILKARRGGYDGKGNFEITPRTSPESALAYFGNKQVMLERKVDFEMEVSVVIARNTHGQIVAYPAVENIHEGGILRTTIAPARASRAVMRRAQEVAHKTLEVLDGAGVFGIEMFVERNGHVLVNEVAPRVHNSGHHTLHSCDVSQFEQHLRAVLGLDLGGVEIERPTVMHNILGSTDMNGRYDEPQTSDPNIHVKMYKKASTKPLRKLGHANIVGTRGTDTTELLAKLESARESLHVRPAM